MCNMCNTYSGRAEKISFNRVSEHIPKNLILNSPKLFSSGIRKHILNMDDSVDLDAIFRVTSR